MYAQLGSIRFTGLKGFTSFDETFAVNWAQHDRITGKPRVEPTGDNLNGISFAMYLHAQFSNVEEDIAALREAMETREVLPLILGNGRVLGNWVIPSISVSTSFTDGSGNLLEATISIELLEFFSDDTLRDAKKASRNKAFATETRNSNIRSVALPKLSAGMATTQDVAHITTSGHLVAQNVSSVESNPSTAEYYSGKISGTFDGMETDIQAAQQTITNSPVLSALVPDLPDALDDVNSRIQDMRGALPITNIPDFKSKSNQLQAAIDAMKTANTSVSNQSVIRRI